MYKCRNLSVSSLSRLVPHWANDRVNCCDLFQTSINFKNIKPSLILIAGDLKTAPIISLLHGNALGEGLVLIDDGSQTILHCRG